METAATDNKVGIHGLVLTGSLDTGEWHDVLGTCARLGYDVVEVPLLEPGMVDGSGLGALFRRHNLTPTASMGLAFDTDISSDDTKAVAAGHEVLLSSVRVLSEIGGHFLGGVLYSAIGKYPSGPTSTGWDNSVSVLREVAAAAHEVDMTLGIEPANRYETNLVNTSAQAVQLIEDIGANNVAVHLDAYHVHIEVGDFSAAVRRCGDLLGYVHVGECHRGYLGTGSVDLPRIFRTLVDVDYRGTITFESFSNAVVSESLSNSLAVWRELWTDGEAVAAHALALIREHLAAARAAARPIGGRPA